MKSFHLLCSIVFFVFFYDLQSISVSAENNVTKIEDVIWDVQYLCFESVNLRDLFSLAQTSQHFSALADDIYKRKYSKKSIRVVHPDRNGTDRIINLSNTIILRSYDTTVNILRLYGHYIKRLELLYPFGQNENITEISYLLNSRCADTIKDIRLEIHQFADFFENMTKPFKKLKEFSIYGSIADLGSSTLSFSELFPALNHLSLKSIQIGNKSSVDVSFEHLEYLYISIERSGYFNGINAEDVEKCLRKNPQIRSLHLQNAKRPLLETTSKILPHIEHLELSCFENVITDEDQEIIFDTVTNLTTSSFIEGLQTNITYPNLTEFHTYMDIDAAPIAIQFVQRNPLLKKLFINGYIHPADFRTLTDAQLNIEEIYMKLMNVVEEQTFNFIRSQHMRKISFNNDVCHKVNEEKLAREFSDEWIIISKQERIWLTRRN